MVNRPDRSAIVGGVSPTPADLAAARAQAGLTQKAAADLVYSKIRAWQRWEAGDRAMHPALWELFNIKSSLTRPS